MNQQTTASKLQLGDKVVPQGLVIALDRREETIKITFKGPTSRVYPNDNLVTIDVFQPLPLPEILSPVPEDDNVHEFLSDNFGDVLSDNNGDYLTV